MPPPDAERRPSRSAVQAAADRESSTFDRRLSGWIDRAEVEYQLAREVGYPAVADVWRRAREDLIDLVGSDR